MVEELVKGLANIVGSVGAPVVIHGAAFFLDADQGQLESIQLGEILFVAVDGEGLPEGVLSGTVYCGKTFLRNRFQKQADIHSEGNAECGIRNAELGMRN